MSNDNRVLDCHAHVVPQALLAEVSGSTENDGVTARRADKGSWAVSLPGQQERLVRPPLVDSEKRIAYLDARHVDAQLVSPWLDIQPTSAMPVTAARSWARRVNQALHAAATRRDVGVLATVALNDPDMAAQDLRDAVRAGMAGLVLSTDPAHCQHLGDPRLEPLWEAAAELRCPVVLHPPTDGPARALPGSDEFGNAYCRLVDTSFAVARLVLSGVLDRLPGLKLVVVHGGGFVPYQAMRWDGAHRADRLVRYHLDRGHPSAYLKDMFFDTVAMSSAAIGFLVGVVGGNRVLLGTDYPFPLGDPDPVRTVNAAGLSASDAAAVLGGSLTELLDGIHRG